nr:MAG TPA: Bacterial peptidase [Microviridae sp.]
MDSRCGHCGSSDRFLYRFLPVFGYFVSYWRPQRHRSL